MLERFKAAASAEGVTFSQWVRESLDGSRAEISEATMKREQTKLERVQMLAKATPGVVRASTLVGPQASPKRTFTPDFK
jgi:hypothetical protein